MCMCYICALEETETNGVQKGFVNIFHINLVKHVFLIRWDYSY